MGDKWSRIVLPAFVAILILAFTTACLRAKIPDKPEPPPIEPNVVPGSETPPEVELVEHALQIDAGVSGKEISFENMIFTHMAIGADEKMNQGVKVWVAVNDEYAGTLYADGWEDEAEEKLLINPGDISMWVPRRGTWVTGENIIQLKFLTPSIGDLTIPALSFIGTLYVKNDPKGLGEVPEEDSDGELSE